MGQPQQSPLQMWMKSIMTLLQYRIHNDPVINMLFTTPNKLEEFLISITEEMKKLTPEQRNVLATREGANNWLTQMLRSYSDRMDQSGRDDMSARYNKKWGAGNKVVSAGQTLNPVHTPAGKKILIFLHSICQKLGLDFNKHADALRSLMEKNGQPKVDKWASEIASDDDLLLKMRDWQRRGLI